MEWHAQQTADGYIMNLQRDLIAYCRSDVDILLRCCMKFRDIFKTETHVDPFLHSLTIASACNTVFRYSHYPSELIGVVPNGGYRRAENQSVIALKWLKWLGESENLEIQHKLNGGEFRIRQYKVDGYCEATNTVYEFHGCW
jgi:hypothetical protein